MRSSVPTARSARVRGIRRAAVAVTAAVSAMTAVGAASSPAGAAEIWNLFNYYDASWKCHAVGEAYEEALWSRYKCVKSDDGWWMLLYQN